MRYREDMEVKEKRIGRRRRQCYTEFTEDRDAAVRPAAGGGPAR